ncbi:serine O-acetyltransferase [Spirosoma panaciterrae]|uniref:serine O-acetyltransferase n=1 Tax=Spirosoma panaciterrae TaxID=496058 RepID=UPI000A0006FE|nr:serine acetyltransferase [Spirosoma panaciterrae]
MSNRFIRRLLYPIYKVFLINHGSYIPLGCKIEGPIKFVHLQGIFISSNSQIGKNCTIYQHVTIGSNRVNTSKKFGSPSIGDNCIIGAGAKIVGGIVIGNNVRIGAGCVVIEDIPDNCTVVSHKPRIIRREI